VVLEVKNLSKSFGGLKVVDQLSFSVARGERLALIGPNGAGKTTVFNLITGVYAPDAGAVLLEGSDITALPSRFRIRRGLARTFQNIRLMPHLTVLENVMIAQYARSPGVAALLQPVGFGRANRWRTEARAALAEAGLESYAGQMAGGLPYGIQKRIELGRALAMDPELLLLDEPVAGMNLEETEDTARYVLEIKEDLGITMILVEHDMHMVMDLADRVMVLDFGQVIATGPPEEVQRDPGVIAAYLGAAS